MADIAMCRNHACERRYNCYRYQAKTSENQVYNAWNPATDKCYLNMADKRFMQKEG